MKEPDFSDEFKHCGFVALVGRPNVGKSTLLNKLIQQKISITSKKPQTTRHQIQGIKTTKNGQVVYVDTPGINFSQKKVLNRYLNKTAASSIKDVDVVLFMTDRRSLDDNDRHILSRIFAVDVPKICLINKTDTLDKKESLLPFIQQLSTEFSFVDIIPVSAKMGENLTELERIIQSYLPRGLPLFPEDQVTDKSERFIAAEIIREKLFRHLGEEIPYALSVEIEKYETTDKLVTIHGLIWVEREGQKAIVIGKKGAGLKLIGTKARLDLEEMVGQKVHLKLWVKIKAQWSSDVSTMRSLGYLE